MQVVRMLSPLLATLYWQQGIHPRSVRIRSELVSDVKCRFGRSFKTLEDRI